ncbi:MAG: hypothetical protein MRQ13_03195 [Candidatus Midichloria sp.]|nr:hypothetical protein [Candidatus Midichloria sp.]
MYILRENNKLVVIQNERIKDLISLNDLYKGIRGVSSPGSAGTEKRSSSSNQSH